jgi:hypothetical protein
MKTGLFERTDMFIVYFQIPQLIKCGSIAHIRIRPQLHKLLNMYNKVTDDTIFSELKRLTGLSLWKNFSLPEPSQYYSSTHIVACEPKSFLKVLSTEKNGALFYVIRARLGKVSFDSVRAL